LEDEYCVIVRTNFLRFLLEISEGYYALISTSTPEGRSNLLRASTVREEEV
jgi:hypothetical protein